MTTDIWTAQGTTDQAIPAVIAELAGTHPELLWLEPRPGGGLDANGKSDAERAASRLHPLLLRADNPSPALDLRPPLAIDEARLFWPGACLHLLADRAPTRWAAWAALSTAAEVRDAIRAFDPQKETESTATALDTEPVLARRDLERFGLPIDTARLPERLQLQRWRNAQGQIAWTLNLILSEAR